MFKAISHIICSKFSRFNLALITLFSLLTTSAIAQDIRYDMTPGVTELSQEVFDLHRLMFWCCVAIAVVVFGVMFYSIFAHRKSRGVTAAQFHESTIVEIIWTAIPFLILILMAIPATRTLVAMSNTDESELTVQVIGSQWKWEYKYLEYEGDNTLDLNMISSITTPPDQFLDPISSAGLFPVGLASFEGEKVEVEKNPYYLMEVDNPLVIPTGKKVRFLITSDDVIHSWWVPDFGIKKDAIPGFINESWANVTVGNEGVYRGFCTELCGKDHAFMPVVVEAKTEEEFETWLAEAQVKQAEEKAAAADSVNLTLTMEESMAHGEEVYKRHCSVCHQSAGQGLMPTFPALAGSDVALNPDRIGEHIMYVRQGKNAMPGFKAILNPKEIATVVTYERNAWGNDTGDLIQPADAAKDWEVDW